MFDETEEYDYGPEHTPKATNTAIAAIHREIEKAANAAARIEELEEALKAAKKLHQDITENRIPTMMRDNGLQTITTPQGLKVEIDKKLFASIPAPTTINKERDPERRKEMLERRLAAIAWLEENGHSSLIKRSFEIEFGRGEEEWAAEFRTMLANSDRPLHVSEGLDVNANSLSALVRELSREGEMYPATTLGVFTKETARVSAVKGKR